MLDHAKLEDLCASHGWSAADLARESGLSYVQARRLLRGDVGTPHSKTLRQLAHALSVDPSFLVSRNRSAVLAPPALDEALEVMVLLPGDQPEANEVTIGLVSDPIETDLGAKVLRSDLDNGREIFHLAVQYPLCIIDLSFQCRRVMLGVGARETRGLDSVFIVRDPQDIPPDLAEKAILRVPALPTSPGGKEAFQGKVLRALENLSASRRGGKPIRIVPRTATGRGDAA